MWLQTKLGERILENRSGAGSALAEHPINSRKVGHGKPFAPDELMFRRRDNQNLVTRDDRLHELFAMDGSFYEAQLRAAALDFSDHLGRIHHAEAYLDPRVGTTECDQVTR